MATTKMNIEVTQSYSAVLNNSKEITGPSEVLKNGEIPQVSSLSPLVPKRLQSETIDTFVSYKDKLDNLISDESMKQYEQSLQVLLLANYKGSLPLYKEERTLAYNIPGKAFRIDTTILFGSVQKSDSWVVKSTMPWIMDNDSEWTKIVCSLLSNNEGGIRIDVKRYGAPLKNCSKPVLYSKHSSFTIPYPFKQCLYISASTSFWFRDVDTSQLQMGALFSKTGIPEIIGDLKEAASNLKDITNPEALKASLFSLFSNIAPKMKALLNNVIITWNYSTLLMGLFYDKKYFKKLLFGMAVYSIFNLQEINEAGSKFCESLIDTFLQNQTKGVAEIISDDLESLEKHGGTKHLHPSIYPESFIRHGLGKNKNKPFVFSEFEEQDDDSGIKPSNLQAGESNSEKIKPVPASLFDKVREYFIEMLASLYDLKLPKVRDIVFGVIHFEKIKSGLLSVFEMIFVVFNTISTYVVGKDAFNGTTLAKYFSSEEIHEFLKEFDILAEKLERGTLIPDYSTYHTVVGMISECESMLMKARLSNGIVSVLNNKLRSMKAIRERLISCSPGFATTRAEPAVCILQGGAGTNKSTVLDFIATVLDPKAPYHRVPSQEYWDGYSNQKVCIFEEFGAMKDSPGDVESECGTVIKAINTAPYPLHMASVEDKGKYQFTSEYCLYTTNMLKITSDSVREIKAVRRRFGKNCYSVCPKNEYCIDPSVDIFNRKVDVCKVTKLSENEMGAVLDLKPEMFEFHQIDLTAEPHAPTGRVLSFDEVVKSIRMQRELNVQRHQANAQAVKHLDDIVQKDSVEIDEIFHGFKEEDKSKDIVETISKEPSPEFLQKAKTLYEYTPVRTIVDDIKFDVVGVDPIKYLANVWEIEGDEVIKRVVKTKTLYSLLYRHRTMGHTCLKGKIMNEDMRSTMCSKAFHYAKDFLKYGVPVVTVTLGFYKIYEYYSSDDGKNVEKPSSVQSPYVYVPQKTGPTKSISEALARPVLSTSQMGVIKDPAGTTFVDSRFSKNCYVLMRNGIRLGTVLFVKDTYAVTSAHFALSFKRDIANPQLDMNMESILDLYRCSGKNPAHYRMTVGSYLGGIVEDPILAERDIYIIKFPGQFNIHSDIRDMFKYASEFKENYECVRRIVYDVEHNVISRLEGFSRSRIVRNHSIDYFSDRVIIPHIYEAHMIGALGQCGSVYTDVNPSVQKKKIIGIHVSGQADKSYFFPITREDLDAVIQQDFCEDEELVLSTPQMGKDDFDDKFTFYRHVQPVPKPLKSTFEKSKIHGQIIEPLTFPAPLRPFGKPRIDPAIVSLSRYNEKQPFFVDEGILAACIESEIDWYRNSALYKVEPRILSTEEAIIGIEGDPDFGPMSRVSSPGYPHILTRVKPKRHDWFGDDPEFDLTGIKCQQMFNNIEKYTERMAAGHRVSFIFTDNLKDECLKYKKVKAGMSRSFSGGDIEYQVLVRKYFGAFMCSIHKNRFTNGCTIGINCYSYDYETMAKLLLSKNKWVNAGDFAGYDTSQILQILKSILIIIEAFYVGSTPEERMVRRMLFLEVYNSTHLYQNNVYRWDCSLPSGHPLTAILNSLYNRIVHKLAFHDLHPEQTILAFWEFNSVVCLLTQGDDSVMSSIPSIHQWYNENTIGASMAKIGLTYTPEDKDESRSEDYRTLYEVSFLKRFWRYDDDWRIHVGVMRLDPLLNQTNWTRTYDSDIIFMDKIGSVMRELSLHEKSIFDKYSVRILKAVSEEYPDFPVLVTNRIALQTQVFNSVLTPCGGSILQMNKMTYTPILKPYTAFPSTLSGENESNAKKVTFSSLQMGEDNMADTKILDDANVVSSTTQAVSRLSDLDRDFKDSEESTITRFLRKPSIVDSGDLSSTDSASTFPSFHWDTSLRASMQLSKFQRIASIKADLVVTLQVNANPFQQGKYILYYVSMGGATTNASEWLLMHRFSIIQILQLPHVIIDVNTDTSAQLVIPWRSAYTAYYYQSTRATLPGYFGMYPYQPVASNGGSTSVSFTLWANYDNIVLGTVGSLQMGKKTVRGRDVLAKEQEGMKISDGLKMASTVSSALSAVPMLSTIAGPLSWVLDASSNAAKAWGFSKPNLVTPPIRQIRNAFPYLASADVTTGEEPLSLMAGNHVGFFPESFGTDLDEMSIGFLASIPSYIGSVDIDVSDTVGTEIAGYSVTPVLSKHVQSDGAVSVTSLGPITFLTRAFNYWRGSLIFHFSFVKTGFHSGRLLFAFQPYDVNLGSRAACTMTDTESMLREIVDLREKTEVDITIPYVLAAPWQETRDDTGEIGVLRIFILDELKAPATVPQTIQMKVTITGGKDFSLAAPRNLEFVPIVPSAVQMGSTLQMGETPNQDSESFQTTTIGGVVPQGPTWVPEEICQGEVIPSLRLLLKRGGYVQMASQLGTASELYIIAPFANYWYTSNGTVVTGAKTTVTRDFYSIFSSIYSMSRGGIRMRFMTRPNATSMFYVSLDQVNSFASSLSSIYNIAVGTTEEELILRSGNQGQFFGTESLTNGFFIPGHTKTVNRINAVQAILAAVPLNYSKGEAAPAQLYYYYVSSTPSGCSIHRAGADDCGFGDFVSIPPMYDVP